MWIVTEDWKSSDPLEGLEFITRADGPFLEDLVEFSADCRPSTLKVGGLITIEGGTDCAHCTVFRVRGVNDDGWCRLGLDEGSLGGGGARGGGDDGGGGGGGRRRSVG